MDYHKNARLTAIGREQMARCVVVDRWTLKAAAARFGVSVKTASKWVERYQEGGSAALSDRSSRPHHCYPPTSSILIGKVLALRRLRWNGWRIAQELHTGRANVSRILRRAGMNRLASLDPPPPVIRYEHARPGSMIHSDIKRLARIVKPGHRIHGDHSRTSRKAGYEYLHIVIDDHSRISFAAILPDQKHASSIRFFHMARAHFSRFGISVQRVLTDNGPLPRLALLPGLAQRLCPATLHQALHIAHQRKGRTLHPDRPQRMGLRKVLSELYGTRIRSRTLAACLQLPPTPC